MEKSLVVLCNAKSLCEYPFYNYNVDTIGMNIAYRFWHQIGWYPTYYVSLDKNVNLNYAKDLYFLVMNREKFGIKKFLFRKVILQVYPQLRDIQEVSFLENINKKNSRGFGDSSHITTGSFAVRWAVYLGYTHIYILGVDSFVPQNDFRDLVDSKGRLKVNLSPDLNKFFDGYQKIGDILHVPSKKNKTRNDSHMLSFKNIYTDISRKKIAKIYISHHDSQLLKKIFPYVKIPDQFIKQRDQWILFNWNEITTQLLEDHPPKIQPIHQLKDLPNPKKLKK